MLVNLLHYNVTWIRPNKYTMYSKHDATISSSWYLTFKPDLFPPTPTQKKESSGGGVSESVRVLFLFAFVWGY